MSEVLVGSAYATMELRYKQFTEGASIVEQQIQRLQQLTKTPIALNVGSGGGIGAGAAQPLARTSAPSASQSVDRDAAAFDHLQRAQAALEAQQARLARSQGDGARAAALEAQAEERLNTVLQAQTGVTTQSIAVERQLATVQIQSARAAQQAAQQQRAQMDSLRAAIQPATQQTAGLTSAVGDLRSVAGTLGVAFGVQQIVSFGEGALRAANSLDRTQSTVRALSGSQERYNEVLATARAGQQAYGGSLEESLSGLGTLVNLSNRAGVSLGTLDNISRRLAIVDPAQGIQGANIALKEFLSGNNAEAALSLARRFELPKDALAALAQEGTTAQQRLDGLNKLLNEQGVTTQVLTDRTKTQAAIYDRLGASALNARDAIGALIAIQGAPAASSATGALTGVTQLITAYNQLATQNTNLFNAVQGILNPIQVYNNAVLGAGANVLAWAGNLVGATDATNAHTIAVMRSADADDRAAAAIAPVIDMEDRRVQQINRSHQASADATRDLIADIHRSAQASAVDTAAKDAQQAMSALVAEQTRQAADAFLALNPQIDQSGILALIAAGKINAQVGQLALLQLQTDQTTSALGRLNIAQGIAAGAASLVPENRHIGGTGNTVGGIAGSIGGGAGTLSAKQDADQRALQDSRDTLALARARTSAQRIAIYERQLNRQTTEEGRNRILAQIEQEKRGGTGRVSAAQSTALQLNQVEQNSGLQLLKTQRENLERLRDQAGDFDVRRSRAQEDFEEKRRKLLAQGQRLQAAQLAQEFTKSQRRDQEDFDRQRRRTLRNNQEGTSDIGARTDLRAQQIGDRAALRGVPVSGARTPDLGQAPPALAGTGGGTAGQIITVRVQIAPTSVQIDGHTIVEITWPETAQRVDTELAAAVTQSGAPAVAQSALGAG